MHMPAHAYMHTYTHAHACTRMPAHVYACAFQMCSSTPSVVLLHGGEHAHACTRIHAHAYMHTPCTRSTPSVALLHRGELVVNGLAAAILVGVEAIGGLALLN